MRFNMDDYGDEYSLDNYEDPEIRNWGSTQLSPSDSIPQYSELEPSSNITQDLYDYGDYNQGQGWQQSFPENSLQSLFSKQGLYSNPEQSVAPGLNIYGNYDNFNSLPQGNISPTTSWGDTLTKMLGGLSGLFGQNKNQQRGGQLSSGLGSIISALLTGKQNTKNAQQSKNIINQQQAAADPFASQRPFYQQQLQQAITNPYSVPIVADQVNALKRAQDIKNAAAGRRSNSATTDPELLKAMAEVAQKYQSSLQQPAGAMIKPNMEGYKELLAANKLGNQGYSSPLMSALGFTGQQNNNYSNMNNSSMDESTLDNLVKVLQRIQQGQGE